MKKFLILVVILYPFYAVSQDNLNSNPNDFHFNLHADAKWRLVSKEDYEKQNPQGLRMLKNPELVCLRSYVHKDSMNIMNPPAVIFQLIKLDGPEFSLDEVKSQADSVIDPGSVEKQLKAEMNDEAARIWVDSFTKGKAYFDSKLNTIITVVSIPGRDGIANIMYAVTYFGKGYMANFKLIYLDNNQKDILPSFIKMTTRSGFDDKTKLR